MSITSQIQTLLGIGPSRSFGAPEQVFSGYVTLTENTIDEIEITQQPVQQGANIADHAFKKPTSFAIQILFGSSLFGTSLDAIYQNLLALQSSFQPFTVTTPKRVYPSMLFKALGCTTDKKSENILAINASFQQIITVPVIVGNVPPGRLKNAGSNSGTQPVGQKQSFLSGIASAVFGNSTVAGLK